MSDVIFVRWEGEPPDESQIRASLAQEGLEPERWSNASGDRHLVHSYDYHKIVCCVEGSIWFTITDERDRTIELEPGDRLEIPPGVRHGAMAGMDGVTCLEAHR